MSRPLLSTIMANPWAAARASSTAAISRLLSASSRSVIVGLLPGALVGHASLHGLARDEQQERPQQRQAPGEVEAAGQRSGVIANPSGHDGRHERARQGQGGEDAHA